MKIKKSYLAAALAAVCALPISLCGCGGNTSDPTDGDEIVVGEGMKKYVLEAEYTPVANVIGGAQSGSASGYDLIMQSDAEGVSNGYFIHNIHMTDCTIVFEFTAEKAGTASISVRLISQWGNTIFDPDNFGVVLNGNDIKYGKIQVQGSSDDKPKFVDKIVTQKAEIKKGDNKLELVVRENTLNTYTKSTGGPAIDCVTIVTDAGISWTPLTENLDHIGNVEG
ncbi:MAG: hypothetical protein OSJ83_00325 [Clostridia bacterium]|nr:hypothetical protein [Clostridia bacterium]